MRQLEEVTHGVIPLAQRAEDVKNGAFSKIVAIPLHCGVYESDIGTTSIFARQIASASLRTMLINEGVEKEWELTIDYVPSPRKYHPSVNDQLRPSRVVFSGLTTKPTVISNEKMS